MRLVQIGPNAQVLEHKGWKVLFSYSLPVAAKHVNETVLRVSMKYSPTISKHVNSFLRGEGQPVLVTGPQFDAALEFDVNLEQVQS